MSLCLMYQLCKGMAFCHGHGVLHRDLKPHNLLMDRSTMTLKIADLGLARAFTLPMKKYTHEILTLWYRAPEVLLGATHYSTAVDMWSVGCIFAELVNKQAIFAGDSELQQLLRIFRLLGTPNEQVWPGVSTLKDWHEYPQWKPMSLSTAVPNLEEAGLDLLSKMLEYEPAKRISAKKAMEHPYFDDLPDKANQDSLPVEQQTEAEEQIGRAARMKPNPSDALPVLLKHLILAATRTAQPPLPLSLTFVFLNSSGL
ncbi:unnamed protein product [Thlaspi arvense]|uniref:cyclin-dependent kinase n=1 Tax=Thlaspi arvense TaxID=13288 RepID=A0AAU9REQ5_THLAR|nr:unnamed protein product [Thlaspi arvense]